MEPFYIKTGQGIRCPNKYYIEDENTIRIEVTNLSGITVNSYIDKEDFEKVKICNWKIRKDSYTYYLSNSQQGYIHRLIMNCPNNLTVDHIDGNGLNNRKSNLRNVTIQENSFNKRNAKLIYWYEHEQRYRIHWRENGKEKTKSFSVSKYKTQEQALKEAEKFKQYIEKEIYKRPNPNNEIKIAN